MIARGGLILVLALLVAVQVVRNAAVAEFAELHPAAAQSVWPGHPAVEITAGMTDIARAARAGRNVDPRTFANIDDAAVKSPLAPEPFLVQGVRAQLAGNATDALRSFVAAQKRDPRSLPAAYFLADQYFRSGNPLDGLREIALVARLSPSGTEVIAPYVADYAQNRANWPQIRSLFQSDPRIEDPVLAALSTDPRSAEAVLALVDREHRNASSQWPAVLVRSLVGAGEYARARAIWADVSGARVGPDTLLYDQRFSSAGPPPPFNWSFASSTVGVAERQPGGRLHLLFYAQEDGVLASQLLLLPAGAYRLTVHLAGSSQHAGTLIWSIRCDKAQTPLSEIGLDAAAAHGWAFQVPAGCAAQWLELSGRAGDIPQQSDVTIEGLSLERAAPHA